MTAKHYLKKVLTAIYDKLFVTIKENTPRLQVQKFVLKLHLKHYRGKKRLMYGCKSTKMVPFFYLSFIICNTC